MVQYFEFFVAYLIIIIIIIINTVEAVAQSQLNKDRNPIAAMRSMKYKIFEFCNIIFSSFSDVLALT